MLSFRWLQCWLSCTILLIHAAPLPSPPHPPPPPSTSTPSTNAATSTSPRIPSSVYTPSKSERKRSSVFSDLLRHPALPYPWLQLYPDPPSVPDTSQPVTPVPDPHPQPPIPTNRPYIPIPEYPSGGFLDVSLLGARCQAERSPTLTPAIPIRVGVVRLFRGRTYRDEAAIVRGCGCMTLESPIQIESFVASSEHSVAFYTGANCEGKPFYQRFLRHYDVDPNMITSSVRIYQGVLPPVGGFQR